MKSIQHLFLISFGLFSCVCDLAMSHERTRELKSDKKKKSKKIKKGKSSKSSTKSSKKNDREKLTGDEEVEYFEVDKDAIRHELHFNEIDGDDDSYITLQDILTYFDEKECQFPFFSGSNLHYQCITDDEASGYEWCATEYPGTAKQGSWKYCKEEDTRVAWNNALASLDTDNDGRLNVNETIDFSLGLCDNAVVSTLNNKCRMNGNTISSGSPNLWYKKDDKCMPLYTNPRNIDDSSRRDIYVKQVRPCGYYGKVYSNSGCVSELSYTILEANVDYPGRGKDGDLVLDALYLTRFDVGRHARQNWSPDRNINVTAINFADGPIDPVPPETIMAAGMTITSETCLEVFTIGGDDWGRIHGSTYNCMGYCGAGCRAWGTGKDCMKHDTCSYYKSLIQGSRVNGYAEDVDCGDEGAQAVINCWDENGSKGDIPIVCQKPGVNSEQYTEINPAARFLGRQACLDRTGWNRNQGMPRPWNFPE